MEGEETSGLSRRARAARAGRRVPAHTEGHPHQSPRLHELGATLDGEAVLLRFFSLQHRWAGLTA